MILMLNVYPNDWGTVLCQLCVFTLKVYVLMQVIFEILSIIRITKNLNTPGYHLINFYSLLKSLTGKANGGILFSFITMNADRS